jgi:hypothetical protein
VARRLLGDHAVGRSCSIDDATIEEACDLAIRKIIGPVDRRKLVDHTTWRVQQLANEGRVDLGRRGIVVPWKET